MIVSVCVGAGGEGCASARSDDDGRVRHRFAGEKHLAGEAAAGAGCPGLHRASKGPARSYSPPHCLLKRVRRPRALQRPQIGWRPVVGANRAGVKEWQLCSWCSGGAKSIAGRQRSGTSITCALRWNQWKGKGANGDKAEGVAAAAGDCYTFSHSLLLHAVASFSAAWLVDSSSADSALWQYRKTGVQQCPQSTLAGMRLPFP